MKASATHWFLILALPWLGLRAAIFTVMNTDDYGAGSLRQVVADAAASAGDDTILFDATLAGATITLASEIVLLDHLTLDATHLIGGITLDGGIGTNRVFTIASGKRVALRGLTITGGNGEGASESGMGGAILNLSNLALADCTLTGNTTIGSGGAIYHKGSQIALTRCTLSNNRTSINGGAISCVGPNISLAQCILTENTADEYGGALSSSRTITLAECTISRNSARWGGGIFSSGAGSLRTLTLEKCALSENHASQDGGAVYMFSLNHFTSTECDFRHNAAERSGGAIYMDGSIQLTLSACSFSTNSAGSFGGALYADDLSPFFPNTADRCAFWNNHAANSGGAAFFSRKYPKLTRCTFSGNSCVARGGAIYSYLSSGSLEHCTLSGNSAGNEGGAIYAAQVLSLANSIVAGNSAPAGPDIVSWTVNRGGVNLIGNNTSVTTGFPAGAPNGNGDFVGTGAAPLDPFLAPLGDYGGFTPTRRLLPGSPAINRIPNPTSTTDQRGFPLVGLADIGAYENGAPTITGIPDQAMPLGSASTRTLAFAIADAETEFSALTLTASSSNTNLVPSVSLALAGGATNHTVTVTPLAGQSGTSTLTVTVNDGKNATSEAFLVSVLEGTPYNLWKIAEFGDNAATPAVAGDTADADGDGLNTIIEYATRGLPLTPGSSPFGVPMILAGPAFRFTMPYRAGTSDLRYRVERSTDLTLPAGGWAEVYIFDTASGPVVAPGLVSTEDSGAQVITLTDTPDGNRAYWRFGVELGDFSARDP